MPLRICLSIESLPKASRNESMKAAIVGISYRKSGFLFESLLIRLTSPMLDEMLDGWNPHKHWLLPTSNIVKNDYEYRETERRTLTRTYTRAHTCTRGFSSKMLGCWTNPILARVPAV